MAVVPGGSCVVNNISPKNQSPSVEAHYCVNGPDRPDTGRNSRGRQIIIKKKQRSARH